jgi:peptidoglycan hydrolase-like protein with peptidoglycan-binding domain
VTDVLDPVEQSPRRRFPHPGRRLLVGAAVLLLVAGIAVAVTEPFGGSSPAASSGLDNGAAVSLYAVRRQSLSSQTQVDGTLGYAGSSTVSVPAGTAPSSIRQAQQTMTTGRQTLATAQAALTADEQSQAQAQAQLTADRLKARADCAGANAAQSGGGEGGNGSGGGGGSASPCASAAQSVISDQSLLSMAEQKVTADRAQVTAALVGVTGANESLAAAQSSAVAYDAGSAYTMLPAAGAVIRRGQPLYAIDGEPTLLFYGSGAAWRAFRPGMTRGRDVAQLNRNLEALGYGHGLGGESYSSATEQAVRALQATHGMAQTGVLALGAVAFAGGPVRVTSVTPALGQAVQAGPVLTVSSTRHEVAIQLDAAQQSQIKVGDDVVVTLPDNSDTPGVVSQVGKVATTPSSDQQSGGSSSPTIEVDVRLVHQASAGSLDQAPVSVSITTARVSDVLVAPVDALLALAGGGYAVEAAGAGGVRHLVAVTLGLFDDARGVVQLSGTGLHPGQRVVVPSE